MNTTMGRKAQWGWITMKQGLIRLETRKGYPVKWHLLSTQYSKLARVVCLLGVGAVVGVAS